MEAVSATWNDVSARTTRDTTMTSADISSRTTLLVARRTLANIVLQRLHIATLVHLMMLSIDDSRLRRMIGCLVDNKLEKAWKEVFVAKFKVPPLHLPE
jgi:hypothetical protein